MLSAASQVIGEGWCDVLTDGYTSVLVDTNRGQALYELEGKYQSASYEEIFTQTYGDPEFMSSYHWGVYVTTFAWEHQLLLCDFFLRQFVTSLENHAAGGQLLDLGCGSGIWSILALGCLEQWRSTIVDISATSIALTRRTLACGGLSTRTNLQQRDALDFRTETAFDAGILWCLLEHLEAPRETPGQFVFMFGDPSFSLCGGCSYLC